MTTESHNPRVTADISTVHQFGRYEAIGPVTLPLELSSGEVTEFSIWYFSFPGGRYAALVKGDPAVGKPPLVRVESICIWAHLFGSQHCDCGWQLEESKHLIAAEQAGLIIVALDQHGKSVGLRNHFIVYAEGQRRGLDLVVDAYRALGLDEDYRNDYSDIADILRHFGLISIRLLSNNPRRIELLGRSGIKIVRVPLQAPLTTHNTEELHTKRFKLGHLFDFGA